MKALDFIMKHRNRRSDWLPDELDLSFASELWQRTIRIRKRAGWELARRHLEVCVFSCLATELKSGDVCVKDSDAYADYRDYLLSWEKCEPMLAEYCNEMNFAGNAQVFVIDLKDWMNEACHTVDEAYPDCENIVEINEEGQPVLKRVKRQESSPSIKHLEKLIQDRLPERNVIDILCNVEHWINWTRHFGPLSGSDPKLENAKERYILNTFAYGCNLGYHLYPSTLRLV